MYTSWVLAGLVIAAPVAALAQQESIQGILHATINNEGVGAAVSQYKTLKEKESGEYSFAETELNALGYRLVQEDNLAAATAMFELNVEAYPNSPNCYDSLGEAYLRHGHYEKAAEMYEKSLSLLETADPATPDQLRAPSISGGRFQGFSAEGFVHDYAGDREGSLEDIPLTRTVSHCVLPY